MREKGKLRSSSSWKVGAHPKGRGFDLMVVSPPSGRGFNSRYPQFLFTRILLLNSLCVS